MFVEPLRMIHVRQDAAFRTICGKKYLFSNNFRLDCGLGRSEA